jgi:hypothetical protein
MVEVKVEDVVVTPVSAVVLIGGYRGEYHNDGASSSSGNQNGNIVNDVDMSDATRNHLKSEWAKLDYNT